MLGDAIYYKPHPSTYKLNAPGPWTLTILAPFNPMFVRPHKRPVL